MKIDSIDVVLLTVVFVLPGFIMNEIIDKINPAKKKNEAVLFLKCLTYSLVSNACLCWIFSLIIRSNLNNWMAYILLLMTTIIGSTVLAMIIAIFKQKEIVDRVLCRLGVRYIHSTETAWDYLFSKQKPCFVTVTLKDGTKMNGWYSSKSFASSDRDERDIYIEKSYREEWGESRESEGFYISKDQIMIIEFKKGADKNE